MMEKININDASIAEAVRNQMAVATGDKKGLMPTLPLVNGMQTKYVGGGEIYKIATSRSLWDRGTFILYYCSDSTLSCYLGSITRGTNEYITKVAMSFKIGYLMKFYHKEDSLYIVISTNAANWGGLYYAGNLLLSKENIIIDDTFKEVTLI